MQRDAGSTTLAIPAGTAAGSYYIVASADDGGAVPETIDTNNTQAVLIRLNPDLVVSSLTVTPVSAAAGAQITVTDTTKNQGSGIGRRDDDQHLSLDEHDFRRGGSPLGSRNAGVLLTGVSSSGQTTVTIPPGTAPGTWYVIARADADGAVAESSETNNNLAKAITITAP